MTRQTNEILIRTPWLMQGYYSDPQKTDQVLQDSYLYTGDQGELDQNGYLKITGRVKDTFKTAKGEYILPASLEEKFADNHYIELVCVVGMGLPQPVALVNLSSHGQVASQTAVCQSLQDTLWAANEGCPGHEKIKKIVIIQESWTVEDGSLTPSLKLKRNVI